MFHELYDGTTYGGGPWMARLAFIMAMAALPAVATLAFLMKGAVP